MSRCAQDPGVVVPVINRNRCEGKGPCVDVCPNDVLAMFVLPVEERVGLSFIGKIKGRVHRWRQANVANPEQCLACGDCVAACPEKAITLSRI